ncbi:MAG: hypothetical protein IAE80_24575 [Anaerolinea sp.]|nr:hypothetical protein [Anaerolinea sp.]
MSVTLALTWHPRGEQERFVRLYSRIRALYHSISLVLSPNADAEAVAVLRGLDIQFAEQGKWSSGRYVALKQGIESGADFIHYCDADRLIRWAELLPNELAVTVERLQAADFTAIGRSTYAFETHPKSLQTTEALTNRVMSGWLGQPSLDLASGSKGFSRAAARFIHRNSQPIRPMGTDAEWAILARRGGFSIQSVEVDGLDWESADQYQDQAADRQRQQETADAYDAKPRSWEFRVNVANEVIEAGLDALSRPLIEEKT